MVWPISYLGFRKAFQIFIPILKIKKIPRKYPKKINQAAIPKLNTALLGLYTTLAIAILVRIIAIRALIICWGETTLKIGGPS